MKHTRRVVITGMGAITPLGHTPKELYANQLEGKSGAGPTFRFDARTFPTKFSSQVKGFELGKYIRNPERFDKSGLNTKFALAAAKDALADAGLLDNPKVDRTMIGVYLGSGEGSHDFPNLTLSMALVTPADGYKVDTTGFFQHSMSLFDGAHEHEVEMHTTSGHVANEFDLRGPNYTCQTACAASGQALGEALELIRRGDADAMITGGSHSMIHPFGVTGFNLLTTLSQRNDDPTKASRPFDLNRDGFVLGEGAGMVVLEELEHAKKRGATIHAELVGYGTTADAYRVTDSHPEGRGAIKCIKLALENAGLKPTDIGYVNAHGTSTHVNDLAETIAIKNVFGEYAYKLPISSIKSMLGHLICAAGVVEMVTSVLTIRHGVLPPTINYETPDPECDLDYVPNVAREVKVDRILSNSFGFGGQNVSLIVSKYVA
ncbi:beta-ketoacyl-[acyl-carrier-protein] synthase family protein [Zavarzinella formosa]|uniref:beta-ketoacyl-[acyl-carrier-protein] synthase family protein n=1 Tax=Zavarzinella formosa TaxID=360055 RepID=UPI00031B25D1|nr:beta-ketoacyl-[acyl-carrier-protein] synthase II [Zavarzinella formosa]